MQTANNVIAPAAFVGRPIDQHRPRGNALAHASPIEFDFVAVARRLGILHYTPRTIVAKIRALVDHNGFPPPLTVRLRSQRCVHGGEAVTRHSIWRAFEVEAWIDRTTAKVPAADREDAERHRARFTMQGRAQLLVAANG